MASQRFEMPAPDTVVADGLSKAGYGSAMISPTCHPLHGGGRHTPRYDLCLQACCANQRTDTVRSRLEKTFRRYGLPEAFFVDNGSPWGDPSGERMDAVLGVAAQARHRGLSIAAHITRKAVARTSGSIARSRPRCCRRCGTFVTSAKTQRAFDAWREVYNFERPHEALGQQVPGQPISAEPAIHARRRLPEAEYDNHEIVRRVSTTKAYVSFKGCLWKVPQAFRGERLAIRPSGKQRAIRGLLRRPPNRYYRFGERKKCRLCPRTPVGLCPRAEHLTGGRQ